jgi:hypothetical protein
MSMWRWLATPLAVPRAAAAPVAAQSPEPVELQERQVERPRAPALDK